MFRYEIEPVDSRRESLSTFVFECDDVGPGESSRNIVSDFSWAIANEFDAEKMIRNEDI